MPKYETVLEIVAENPGIDTEEFRGIATELADEPDAVVELLNSAVAREDVIRVDGKHWIVRRGPYAYSNYDHPES